MSGAALFFSGAFVALSLIAALFFIRFRRDSGDRLFAWFAWAFVLLAVERVLLDFVAPFEAFYICRLAAFLLIIVAIVEKNRAQRST